MKIKIAYAMFAAAITNLHKLIKNIVSLLLVMYNVYINAGVRKMSVRMQIYLSKEQYELLKQKSKQTGQPMAAYIRESLSKYLAETDRTQVYSDDPIWEITGKTSSASDELSTRHDYFLYEQDDSGEN